MTVGVAISTHRRPEVLARALQQWAKWMPDILVVIHDVAGDGVAATKNRGIAALMNAQVEHLFLADDDVWPVNKRWAKLYVQDPEPHLMHIWGKNTSRFIADDGHYTTWNWPKGVLLYAERRVVEKVGGMRTEFGRWGGEHREWSNRIHAAGLTKHAYADLSAARHGIWYCEDYTHNVRSTVTPAEKAASQQHRQELYDLYRGNTDYVEYRT